MEGSEGGCGFKWGPGKAPWGVIPEQSRGSEAGRYLGKGIPTASDNRTSKCPRSAKYLQGSSHLILTITHGLPRCLVYSRCSINAEQVNGRAGRTPVMSERKPKRPLPPTTVR